MVFCERLLRFHAVCDSVRTLWLMPIQLTLSKVVQTNTGLIETFFTIFIPS